MHNFKKALLASLSFLLCFALLFALVVYPAFKTDSLYNDSAKRRELAGSIDMLYCGASHALGGFIPDIIDNTLGTNSYNLSSYASSFEGRIWLIEKELARNKVDSFVLEISYDTIRDYSDDRSTGEPMTILKLDSFAERLSYMAKYVPITNLDKVSSVTLRYGLNAWKAMLTGQLNIPQNNRGYVPARTSNLRTQELELAELVDTRSMAVDFDPDNLEKINKIAAMCRDEGSEFIIAVVPVSDKLILNFDNCDEFYSALDNFCKQQGYEYYDFNLLKNRGELFSDNGSYFDSSHLSHEGAESFSTAFAQLMLARNEGRDTSEFFYPSYEAARAELIEKYS